jgi:hypothetical protein
MPSPKRAAADEALPGIRFIDPAALARIGNLELVARWVVEGFISGLHRSPHFGFSTDFAEHRQYMPGDDIRHIDWRVYARTDDTTSRRTRPTPTPTSWCCSTSPAPWDTDRAR